VSGQHSGIGMTSQRTRMRMVERLREQGIRDEVVLGVMGEVPRHLFVDEALASRAYEDISLPLGFGQTISSPYTVARMTELARGVGPLNKVLEIGTGCGYQAAVLSRLAKDVYSIERVAGLLAKARKHFRELRILNVRLRHGDGHVGMTEVAPYDAIVMTAAATHVPPALLEQLAVGAKMIFPMAQLGDQRGAKRGEQRLCVIERTPHGYVEKKLDVVKFVPMLPGVA
jgi:protein-L-isoaspartate(D-aspartate) O-methyltransferase